MLGRLGSTLLHEARSMAPTAIFFLVTFNLLVLTVSLLDDGYAADAGAVTHAAVSVGALLAAKAVLLADMLPVVNRFAGRPLIRGIAWKASIYFAAAFALHLAERLLSAATGEYGFVAEVRMDVSQFDWAHFWVTQIWLAVLFPVFAAVRESIREIGPDRIRAMLFGTRSGPADP